MDDYAMKTTAELGDAFRNLNTRPSKGINESCAELEGLTNKFEHLIIRVDQIFSKLSGHMVFPPSDSVEPSGLQLTRHLQASIEVFQKQLNQLDQILSSFE